MQEIKGYDRSIQELLSGGSYGIDYYQRETNGVANSFRNSWKT